MPRSQGIRFKPPSDVRVSPEGRYGEAATRGHAKADRSECMRGQNTPVIREIAGRAVGLLAISV